MMNYDINTTELYLADCTSPSGSLLMIDPDGDIQVLDSSASLRGYDDWVYLWRAEGDYDRTAWGVEWDDDAGCYIVRDADGEIVSSGHDDDSEALQSAVRIFGLPAEIHDELLQRCTAAN